MPNSVPASMLLQASIYNREYEDDVLYEGNVIVDLPVVASQLMLPGVEIRISDYYMFDNPGDAPLDYRVYDGSFWKALVETEHYTYQMQAGRIMVSNRLLDIENDRWGRGCAVTPDIAALPEWMAIIEARRNLMRSWLLVSNDRVFVRVGAPHVGVEWLRSGKAPAQLIAMTRSMGRRSLSEYTLFSPERSDDIIEFLLAIGGKVPQPWPITVYPPAYDLLAADEPVDVVRSFANWFIDALNSTHKTSFIQIRQGYGLLPAGVIEEIELLKVSNLDLMNDNDVEVMMESLRRIYHYLSAEDVEELTRQLEAVMTAEPNVLATMRLAERLRVLLRLQVTRWEFELRKQVSAADRAALGELVMEAD